MTPRGGFSRGFVPIRRTVDVYLEDRRYSREARYVLLSLLLLANPFTSTVEGATKTALAEHLGFRGGHGTRTLSAALDELEAGGTIACKWVRGHEGRIEVLDYAQLVNPSASDARPHQPPTRERSDRPRASAATAHARVSSDPALSTRARDENTTTENTDKAGDRDGIRRLVDAAIQHLVGQEEAAAPVGSIRNPPGWRRCVRDRLRGEHGEHLAALAESEVNAGTDFERALTKLVSAVHENGPEHLEASDLAAVDHSFERRRYLDRCYEAGRNQVRVDADDDSNRETLRTHFRDDPEGLAAALRGFDSVVRATEECPLPEVGA